MGLLLFIQGGQGNALRACYTNLNFNYFLEFKVPCMFSRPSRVFSVNFKFIMYWDVILVNHNVIFSSMLMGITSERRFFFEILRFSVDEMRFYHDCRAVTASTFASVNGECGLFTWAIIQSLWVLFVTLPCKLCLFDIKNFNFLPV